MNPIPNINSHTRTIELMVHEARVVTDGLDPENNILTCAGVKIPHPEPYSGEPDLERFEVFVTGLLRWLSMNLLLGSEVGSTLAQLRYLGTCLQNGLAEIYPPPFKVGRLRYIICLLNGSAKIYHMPSEQVSQHISTPFQWVSPDISGAFMVGQPRYITCLHNGWAHRLGTGYTSPLTTHQPLISILENYYS